MLYERRGAQGVNQRNKGKQHVVPDAPDAKETNDSEKQWALTGMCHESVEEETHRGKEISRVRNAKNGNINNSRPISIIFTFLPGIQIVKETESTGSEEGIQQPVGMVHKSHVRISIILLDCYILNEGISLLLRNHDRDSFNRDSRIADLYLCL